MDKAEGYYEGIVKQQHVSPQLNVLRSHISPSLPHARLRNRGYAFGLWVSLSVHTFWAICAIKALSRHRVAPER